MKRPMAVALIGYQFMGREHSHALKNLPMFADDSRPSAGYYDGPKWQEVIDAVGIAANEKQWVNVS